MTHQNSSFSFFDNIRDKVNVSDIIRQTVSLTRKGQEYSGLCPFHNEKTPSFTVNDIKKFYHCFGCGAHGDVIKFLVETKGFSYLEAAKKLATDNGIEDT
ncbi:MAG UNVERIFIED_CONTAM: CHC2 zinc finger domain-containing protein [Rickettsiaceae bacterium]